MMTYEKKMIIKLSREDEKKVEKFMDKKCKNYLIVSEPIK